MDLGTLQTIWFVLFLVLVAGYAVLDGFDLGIGALSLLERNEARRGQHMEVIAPVWDGNEVWLLTAGGALFAAFPPVYATVFSGFYLALMLLLAALMFRGVSFKFRNQVASPGWRRFWDRAFGLGSLVPALLCGVAVGNILKGGPVQQTAQGFAWQGSFLGLLNPYALLVGVLGLAMFLTHGAIYMAHKAHGEAAASAARKAPWLWLSWMILWGVTTGISAWQAPHLFEGATGNPLWWVTVLVALAAMIGIPWALRGGRHGVAFLWSCAAIAAQNGLAALGLYPRLVPSSLDLAGSSLTIHNASSSERTLGTMLVIALVGMPLVVGYTAFVYRVFRGRVKPGEYYGNH